MRVSVTWQILGAAFLTTLAGLAGAKSAPSGAELVAIDLDTALARAIASNPALKAAGFRLDAQGGLVTQAGVRPNATVDLFVENFLGSGVYEAADATETTLTLTWVLERGKRARQVDALRANGELLAVDAEVQQIDTAADTALVYLDSLAFQARLLQTAAAEKLAEQTASAVRQRVQSGGTPAAELSRAEAELARARLRHEDIEHQLLTSYRRLAAQWGQSEPDFDYVAGDIQRLPVPDDYPQLLARVQTNPRLSRFLNERRLREAELKLAEAEARPDWRLLAGVRRLEISDDEAFVAGVVIPITTRSRNEGRIAAANARLASSDATKVAAQVEIETQLFILYEDLQHNLHTAETLRDEVLPRLEKALKDTERAYKAGRYGYFELRLVQAEILEAQTALIETSIAAHRDVIEIERLTGTAVTMPALAARGTR